MFFKVSFKKEHKVLSFIWCVWFKELTLYSLLVWLLSLFKGGGPDDSRLLSCEIDCSLLNSLLQAAKLKWQWEGDVQL